MRRIKRAPGAIHAFSVYPEDGREYYSVQVWPSRRLMREYIAATAPHTPTGRIIACVLWPAKRRPRHIGEIHFNTRDLGQDTISHEATHAALEWARRQGLDVDNPLDPDAANDDEERFCEALAALTYQIWEEMHQRHLMP